MLRRFGHWNISAICLTVVLKLAITVFLACIFKHSDQNDLIFSVISKTFQAMTEKTESSYGITMEKQLLDGSFGAMMQSY